MQSNSSRKIDVFSIDTDNPSVTPSAVVNIDTISNSDDGVGTFTITVSYSESMLQSVSPVLAFDNETPTAGILTLSGSSGWQNATDYQFVYDPSRRLRWGGSQNLKV